MYGLGQFHHQQNKGGERRGEGRFGKTYGVGQFHHRQKRREEVRVCQKKIEQLLSNIEVVEVVDRRPEVVVGK